MSESPSLYVLTPDDWREYRAIRLRALADSPDAFASTLAREEGRPDAEWANRVAAAADAKYHLPLVARLGTRFVGLAWGRIMESDPSVAYLFQMWVAPEARRFGVGRLLVEAVIDWARHAGARQLELEVTCGNAPAWTLYSRAGFQPVGEPKPFTERPALLEQRMRLDLSI